MGSIKLKSSFSTLIVLTAIWASPGSADKERLEFVVVRARLPVLTKFISAAYLVYMRFFRSGNNGSYYKTQISKYSVDTDRLTTVGTFTPIDTGSVIMTTDETILYYGGVVTGAGYIDTINSYSIRYDNHSVTGTLPAPMGYSSVAWDSANQLAYLFGGFGNGLIRSITRHNATTNEVKQVGTLPAPNFTATAVWATDGQSEVAYCFGGNDQNYSHYQKVVHFDPESGHATTLAETLPHNLFFGCAVFVPTQNQVYVFGGSPLMKFDTITHSIEVLEVDKWPRFLQTAGCAYVPRLGRMYIFGGSGSYDDEANRDRDEIAYVVVDFPETTSAPSTTDVAIGDSPTTTARASTIEPPTTMQYNPTTAPPVEDEGASSALWLISGVGGGIFLIATVVIVGGVCWWRTQRTLFGKNLQSTQQFRKDMWPQKTQDPVHILYDMDSDRTLGPGVGTGTQAALVLPYDVERYEISIEHLQIGEMLGSGEFGVVYRAALEQPGEPLMEVAAKKLKPGTGRETTSSFINELKINAYVGVHRNIVKLIGGCTTTLDNLCIVLEFCENGNLNNLLRANRSAFRETKGTMHPAAGYVHASHGAQPVPLTPMDMQDLFRWTTQIAEGMDFLSVRNIVHGDLACRNVLLDSNLVAKISDFGLASRFYEYSIYVRSAQRLLPWQWMAIEALQDMRFSHAPDVWAFGITAWEVYTLANVPYPGYTWSEMFLDKLAAGYRNTRPKYANLEIYAIMEKCWAHDHCDRPDMATVKNLLLEMGAAACQQKIGQLQP